VIKQVAHKITSIMLSFLVLFSTLSFTVEKHYCGDRLVDIAIFKEAQKCAMETLQPEQETATKIEKSCCKDEVNIISGQDELKRNSLEDLKHNPHVFLQAFVVSYTNLFEGLPKHIVPFKNYIPSKLVRDIHILDQVYLI